MWVEWLAQKCVGGGPESSDGAKATRRWSLQLGAPEFVFVFVAIGSLWRGRTRFLNDPGTFWHLRLGREMLATGAVPREDFLTSTRFGTPWVDQSWLFDLGLAWVVNQTGWAGAAVLTALVLGAVYAGLAYWLEKLGASWTVSAATAIIASTIGSIHFLTRPHIFTFAGVLAALVLCRRFHERGGWSIWAMPGIVAIWANLHGGFLAGPLIVFTAAAGHAASGEWDRARRRRVATFVAVGTTCTLAALVNPYSWHLYEHVMGLLVKSKVTDLIQEYQPVPWGRLDMLLLEMLVIGMIVLPVATGARPSLYDLAHVVVWLHLGMSSLRNVPLFALAAAPVVSQLLGAALPSSELVRGGPGRRAGAWGLACALCLGVATAIQAGFSLGNPDPKTWPFGGLAALNQQPVDAKLFHEQDWGGMIENESVPARKARMDDRFELWGRQPLLDYVEALKGGPGWDDLDGRESFELVWLRPTRGLAKRLERDDSWRELYRDEVSVLYARVQDKGGLTSARSGLVDLVGQR